MKGYIPKYFSLMCRWSMWPMGLVLGVCLYQYGPKCIGVGMPVYVYLTSLFVLSRWPGPDHCQRTPGGSAGRGLWMSGRCLPLVLPSQKPSKCTYLLSIPWLHSGHYSFFWPLWVIYIHEHSIHLYWRVIEVICPNQQSLLLHNSIWLDIKFCYCSSNWANAMQDYQKLDQWIYSFLHGQFKIFNNRYIDFKFPIKW